MSSLIRSAQFTREYKVDLFQLNRLLKYNEKNGKNLGVEYLIAVKIFEKFLSRRYYHTVRINDSFYVLKKKDVVKRSDYFRMFFETKVCKSNHIKLECSQKDVDEVIKAISFGRVSFPLRYYKIFDFLGCDEIMEAITGELKSLNLRDCPEEFDLLYNAKPELAHELSIGVKEIMPYVHNMFYSTNKYEYLHYVLTTGYGYMELLNPYDYINYLMYCPLPVSRRFEGFPINNNVHELDGYELEYEYDGNYITDSDYYPVEDFVSMVKAESPYKIGESVFVDPTSFKRCFNEVTKGIFDEFNWDSVVYTGGSLYLMLSPYYNEDHARIYSKLSDIDLFLYGSDDNQKAKMVYILDYIKKHFDNVIFAVKKSVVDIYIKDQKVKIQVICSGKRTVDEILLSFDHSIMQMGYLGGDKFVCTPACLVAYRYQTSYCEQSKRYRLGKIVSRGLGVCTSRKFVRCLEMMSDDTVESLLNNFYYKLDQYGYNPVWSDPFEKIKFEIALHTRFSSGLVVTKSVTDVISKFQVGWADYRNNSKERFTTVPKIEMDEPIIRLSPSPLLSLYNITKIQYM